MHETSCTHKFFEDIIWRDYLMPPINSNSILCSKVNRVQLRVLYLVCLFVLIGSLIIITRWYIEHVFLIALIVCFFFLLKVISKYQSAQPKKTTSFHHQLTFTFSPFLKGDFPKILHKINFNFQPSTNINKY